ncbi:MAG TPA: hypothetical protein VLB83_01405 [Candidatus Paceibacterota bacterium]|nr:hypothetical protein [Candidatus Paceibacterota bacterium]
MPKRMTVSKAIATPKKAVQGMRSAAKADANDPLLAIARIAERTLLFTKYADHNGPMIERLVARRLSALRHAVTDKKLELLEGDRRIDNEQELERIFTKLFAEIPARFNDAKRDLSMREIVADAAAILKERGMEIVPALDTPTSPKPSSSPS